MVAKKWSLSFRRKLITVGACFITCEMLFQDFANAVLLYLEKTLSSLSKSSHNTDLPSFISPRTTTGESLRPDFVLLDSSLYILEPTVGFESNIQINSERKKAKYHSLISDLAPTFSSIQFMNLSMSTLGVLGKSSNSLLLSLEDLKFDKPSSNRPLS